jgi:hypothetical protein
MEHDVSAVESTSSAMSGSSRCSLPDTFWQRFVEDHWETGPTVMRAPFERPVSSGEEVLAALIRAAEAQRGGRRGRLRMFVEHAPLITDVDRVLPSPELDTLDTYVRHARGHLGGRDFELVCNGLQVHAPALWYKIRSFMSGLIQRVGLPSDHADLAAFLRTSQMTGFGVHKDKASVFIFVLEGRKRILAWPHDVFARHPDSYRTLEYADHLDQAIVLEGQPGDVIYWPSSFWHVGESDGDTSVSLHLALNMHADPHDLVLQTLKRLLRMQDNPVSIDTFGMHLDGSQQSVMSLPSEIAGSAARLREVAESGAIEAELSLGWLERVSASGFVETPPPRAARALTPSDRLRGDTSFPILVVPLPDKRIACAANGHSFTIPFHPALLDLVETLNSGVPQSVGDLETQFSGALDRDVLLRLLDRFHSLRALDPEAP